MQGGYGEVALLQDVDHFFADGARGARDGDIVVGGHGGGGVSWGGPWRLDFGRNYSMGWWVRYNNEYGRHENFVAVRSSGARNAARMKLVRGAPVALDRFRDRFGRSVQLRWQTGIAVFILAFAMLSGLFWPRSVVDSSQFANWVFNYDLGYAHRAFMGSFFQFIHGEPTRAKILEIVPVWEYWLLAVLILFMWCLLVPRLLLSHFSSAVKWLLLAFCALVLLAPIWRTNMVNVGFMDKWIFLAVLLAFSAFIANKPIFYWLFCSVGITIHPMMVFYNLLMSLFVLHAVFFLPAYGARRWLPMCVAVPLMSLFFYGIHDNARHLALIEQYADELLSSAESVSAGYAHYNFENLFGPMLGRFMLFPRNAFLGFIFFNGIALTFAIALAVVLKRYGVNFGQATALPWSRLRPAVEKYNLLILLAPCTLFMLPINAVAVDWSRFFYHGWWMLGLALIYLIWFLPDSVSPRKEGKRPKRSQVSIFVVAGLVAAVAYGYGGAPLNVSHINRPWVFSCRQFCIPLLTVNPVGEWYSGAVFSVLRSALLPIHAGPVGMRMMQGGGLSDFDYQDDGIVVSADYRGPVFSLSFTSGISDDIVVVAKHESVGEPPLELSVNNGDPIPPSLRTPSETRWAFRSASQFALPSLSLRSVGGAAFKLSDFSIYRQ